MSPKAATKASPLTEAALVERIRSRYTGENGNGPAGCVVAQVRNQAGFDASRTIDALGFHFWPSRGLLIDGFECKSSRSDWTRELEDPAKADTFCRLVDRFYIVAGRADLVKLDELPPEWGLLVPHGAGLKEVKPAAVMHADSLAITEWAQHVTEHHRAAGPRPLPPGFDRSFLIALVRQAYKLTSVEPVQLAAARDDAYKRGAADGERSARRELERLRTLEGIVREFEQALGYSIKGHRPYLRDAAITPAEIGRTLRTVLEGDAQIVGLRNRLNAAAENAERLAREARAQVQALDVALGSDGGGQAR